MLKMKHGGCATSIAFVRQVVVLVVVAILVASVMHWSLATSYAAAASNESNQRIGITDTEVFVGAGLPLTGEVAGKGLSVAHAVNSYFEWINEQGGVNGRKLKLLTCDDAYDPDKATACYYHCFRGKIFVAGFAVSSATIVRYLKYGSMDPNDQLPLIGFLNGTAAIYESHHQNVFTCRPSYAAEAKRQVDMLCEQGIKRVGILYQYDAFGVGCYDAVQAALRQHQLSPCGTGSYSRTAGDVEPALKLVLAARPEAIILAADSATMKKLIELRSQYKFKNLLLAFSPMTDALVSQGDRSDGMLISQVMPPLTDRLRAVSLYHSLLKKYYPKDLPTIAGTEAFVNAIVLVEGLKRAGRDLTRDKFIAALETLHDFDVGLSADYKVSFSEQSHVGWSDKVTYLAIASHGKVEPLTVPELKRIVSH